VRKSLLFTGSILLAAGLLAATAAAEVKQPGPLFSPVSPRFAADLTPNLQPDGSTLMLISIQIPYSELQFVRVPAGHGAAVDFMVVLRDLKGRHVGGDAWEERFVVRSFAETKTPSALVSVKRRFPIDAGKFEIRIRLLDVNSGRESSVEGEIEVEGLGGGTLGLAEPLFGECRSDSAAGGYRFVQNTSRRYTTGLDGFCVQGRIYDAGTEGDSSAYHLAYKIEDHTGSTVSKGDTLLVPTGDGSFFLRPDVTRFFLGSYTLELEVEAGGRKDEVRASFDIDALTVPQGEQWKIMVEALGYLISPSSLIPLREAETEEDRALEWNRFWREQDPTPETERNEALIEFVRRIRYANASFRGFGLGWKTDQGRIYIQHGPPDQIEDRPMSERSQPQQIWHYYDLGRDYVFVDRDGFGRYELLTMVEQ
jgi:GWxTD domain-containing protein